MAQPTPPPPLPTVPPPPPPPPPGTAPLPPPAGLGSRFVAAIIDLVILFVISLVITIPLAIVWAIALLSGGSLGYLGFFFGPIELVLFALFLLYFTYFEGTSGQTVGKRIMGLKVIQISTGRPPDLGRSFVRNILRIVDWLPFLYLIGFIVAILTSRKQRLGDLLAETVVVHG